jgi:hypothetical protein
VLAGLHGVADERRVDVRTRADTDQIDVVPFQDLSVVSAGGLESPGALRGLRALEVDVRDCDQTSQIREREEGARVVTENRSSADDPDTQRFCAALDSQFAISCDSRMGERCSASSAPPERRRIISRADWRDQLSVWDRGDERFQSPSSILKDMSHIRW